MTHCSSPKLAFRSWRIAGRATLTTVTSSSSIAVAAETTIRVIQRAGPEITS